jgi:PPOX class probable F420-dependent enzyme
MPVEERSSLVLTQRLRRLLEKPVPAVVATRRLKGYVQAVPAWFEFRDSLFWLNSHRARSWPQHIQRDGRVTLLILDREDDHYWAQVEGRLVEATTEGAESVIERLARRYTGKPFRALQPGEERITLTIQPVRITGEGID